VTAPAIGQLPDAAIDRVIARLVAVAKCNDG